MNEKKLPTIKEVFDLALHNHQKNNLKAAEKLYKQILEIKSDHFESTFYLGSLSIQTKNFDRAKQLLQRAIQIQPNHVAAHNNLGIVFQELGEREKAKSCYEKAIQIDPNHADAYNNIGMVFRELGEFKKAKNFCQKAIQIDPNHTEAYWNLHSFASNIDEALTVLKKLYNIDNKFFRAKSMISALQGFRGNFKDFDALLTSSEANHPYTRSIKWVFSLPLLPKIFFNLWDFFDAVIDLTDK